jgi:hypothetical protein
MRNGKSVAASLLAMSLSAGPTLHAQNSGPVGGAQPTQELVRTVRIATGSLRGKILTPGTREPAAGQKVVVRDGEGKEIANLTTKADGTYETPPLNKGNYSVQIGDGARVDLMVTPEATISNLDIVMPQTAAPAPGGAEGTAPRTAGATPTPTTPTGANAAPTTGTGAGAGTRTAAGGAGAAATGGLGLVGWGLIGAGAAAAVAVPIALSSGGSGSGQSPVSGSSSQVTN